MNRSISLAQIVEQFKHSLFLKQQRKVTLNKITFPVFWDEVIDPETLVADSAKLIQKKLKANVLHGISLDISINGKDEHIEL